jgi:uncharacterized protein
VFEWDDGNLDHIDVHRVSADEVEEALLDPNRRRTASYNTDREKRRAFIGATEAGRILFVVYTRRSSRVRAVTARDATDDERRRYRRH